jgi:CSLREA domain-containing protein
MRASLPAHLRKRLLGIGLALVLLGWLALPHAPAEAATFTVTKTTDTNDGNCNADCSLREAVIAGNAAAGPDTIEIPGGYYRLTLAGDDDMAATGDLDITSQLTLKAIGPVTVDGGGIDRVVHVLPLANAKLLGLRITGGVIVGFGGGIFNNGGTLTLISSTVSGNEATLNGGGIVTFGTATLTNSRVSGNQSSGAGGGIRTEGTATLTNSTVSGNQADGSGGGIAVFGGTATISGSTIAANRSDADGNDIGDGGGIFKDGGAVVGNSILAGNFDGPGTIHPDCFGTFNSNDHNLIGDATGCEGFTETNDDIGTVALGPLAFNGGPTETHSLPAGSDAVNHGPTSGSGTDQRGVVRPVGAAFDTGAYERVLCSGLLVNVVGTNAKDTLTGTARGDGVLAQGGNDTVRARAGNDKACGGNGNDKLFGEAGDDKLLGEAGNDLLDGGSGNDACVGGPGTDKLKSC